MKRGPRLRKNQYITCADEIIPQYASVKRITSALEEAWGLKRDEPMTEGLVKALEKFTTHNSLRVLVTVRRDGSKHYKVIG